MGLAAALPSDSAIGLPRALSIPTMASLSSAFAASLAGPDPVVLLAGRDGVFCQGLDLAAVVDDMDEAMESFVELLLTLQQSAKPTLALVDGNAIGGGLGILAACDVVLATDRSRFALPEALYGLLPNAIFPILLERLSLQKLRLLLVDGASRDASWALAHGLVDEVVPAARLAGEAKHWTRRLARTASGGVVGALRGLCRECRAPDAETLIRRGAARTLAALAEPDRRARLRAFVHEGVAPWEPV